MKKLISVILALVMVLSLVGCVDTADGKKDPDYNSFDNSNSSVVSSEQTEPIVLSTKDDMEFCLVDSGVKEYLEKAKDYDPDDFSSSIVNTYLGNGAKLLPVYLSWMYEVQGVTDVNVLISLSQDMSNAAYYPSEVNAIEINNLMTGTTYYWCVEGVVNGEKYTTEVRSFRTEDTVRLIKLSGVGNTRDIGSWKDKNGNSMRQGLAYRGKALTDITAEGIAAARQLGIRTQLDLRSNSEFKADLVNGASKLGEDVKTINIPATQYKAFLNDRITAKEIKVFADWSNYPIYFHCAAGADRTGSLAFLLQGLCGVEEPSLIMDYELTVYRNKTHAEFPEFVKIIRGFDGETMQEKLYNHCRNKFNLTPMELSNIYNIFMTESAVFASNSLTSGRQEASGVSFDLDLRKSGGVSSVKVNGADVKWSMNGNTLTVKADSGEGIILLKDGAELKFSI